MPIQTTPEQQQDARLKSHNAGALAPVSRWSWGAGSFFTESRFVELAVLFIFGLYVRAVTFAPVYDDNTIGPPLTLRDLPTVFSHDIFYNVDGNAHSVYYRPLATTWAMLVGTVTGGAPGWFHLVAILMHIAVVVLAYVFGCQLLRDRRLALLTALLFGLHPSKVESVVWIGSSLVDGFGAIFFFASLVTFLKWHESRYSRWLVASVALFTCSLFVKETMVIVPALIAAYLWLKTPRVGRFVRTALTLLPYGLVWAIYMAIRHQVIKPAGPTVEYVHPTVTFVNLWNAPYSIWWYIRHLLMPWGLSVEYVTKGVEGPSFGGFVLPFVGLSLLLTLGVWLWNRRRSSTVGFLAFWFVVTLAPPVFFAPMVGQHDRYVYLASYAFCALVAWAVLYLGTVSPKVRAVAVLAVVAMWSGLTWHEMGYWDCDKTLWGRVLEISPSHPKACVQLAIIESVEGNVPEALRLLDVGLQYRPNYAQYWLMKASILNDHKQFDAARADYLKTVDLTDPALPSPRPALIASFRSVAASQLALMDLSSNNFVEAEHYARMALESDPKGVGFHSILAKSLLGQGRNDEAKVEDALELGLWNKPELKRQSQTHP